MKYLIPLVVVLSGCATPPQWLANHFDSLDPCQTKHWQDPQPRFCGASSGRTTVYSTPQGQPLGAPIGYTKTR